MSRDGSGNFSLVAGNPVVTGTTITVTWANTTLADIATALTGSLARDGQAAATGPLNMGSNAITGATTIAASGAVTAASLIPTNATVPANGMYLSAANTVAFATNSTLRASIDTSGNLVITGSLTGVNAVLSGSLTAVGATLTGTILLGGVNITDYARLSQSNTFTNGTQKISITSGNAQFEVKTTDAAGQPELKITNSTNSWSAYMPAGTSNLRFHDGGNDRFVIANGGNFDFKGGTVTTNKASPNEVGFNGLPRTTSAPNPGECRAISAGVTINTGLVAGQFYSYYNDSAAQVTLTKGTVTNLRLAGTTSDGNRTIEARGMATIWANSATEFIVSGPGVG